VAKKALSEVETQKLDDTQRHHLMAASQEFDDWLASQRSFAWQVGWGIADSLVAAVDYQTGLYHHRDVDTSEIRARQLEESFRSIKTSWIVVAVMTVLGICGLATLAGLEYLSVLGAIGWSLVWLIAMTVVGILACLKPINTRFQVEQASNSEAVSKGTSKVRGLSLVSQEVIRLGGIAVQIPAWIHLISELVHHTGGFSRPGQSSDLGSVTLTGRLPLAMQVAQVSYTPDLDNDIGQAHEALSYAAKARLLSVGWFTRLARARIRDAGRQWCARHDVGDNDFLEVLLSDARQALDGPLAAVVTKLADEHNRSRSNFDEQLRSWVTGDGRPLWEQALKAARLTAGVASAFEPTTALAELSQARQDQFSPLRADFSLAGQGRGFHGRITDLYPPAIIGSPQSSRRTPSGSAAASPVAADGFIEAVSRTLTSQLVDPEDLRCCEQSSDSQEDGLDQVLVAPQFDTPWLAQTTPSGSTDVIQPAPTPVELGGDDG
jgi:hypothetical protein